MAIKKPALGKVGYGKPPAKTQFKKGESGNPKGRPKGTRNLEADVKAMLQMPVPIERDSGRKKKISTQQASLLQLRAKALRGDQRALDRLLDLAARHNSETDARPVVEELTPDEQAIIELFRAKMGFAVAPVSQQANSATNEEDQS